MSSSPERLTLLNLPSDVIRTIIRVGLEDVDKMKLISPAWNDLAAQHLSARVHLPVLKSFTWSSEAMDDRLLTNMELRVPARFRAFLGLHNWKSYRANDFSIEFTSAREVLSTKERNAISVLINRIFGRCSRIEQLDVSRIAQDEAEVCTLKNAMRGLIVDELCFGHIRDCNKIKHEVLDLISLASRVKRIRFFKPMFGNFPDAFIPILRQFLPHVPTIDLTILTELDPVHDEMVAKMSAIQLQKLNEVQKSMDDGERVSWLAFNNKLCDNKALKAEFHEEARPNGAYFCITIVAKE